MSNIEEEFMAAWEEKGGGQLADTPQGEPEPEAVTEPPEPDAEEPAAEEAPKKWGERFDTPEELETWALENNSKLGSMANEIGQLRQYVQGIQEQQQRDAQPQVNVDDDPRAATYEAVKRGDYEMYQRAWAAWADEEPGAAGVFDQQVRQAQINAAVSTALYQRDAVQNTTRAAWDSTRARLPEFDTLIDPMVEAAKRVPNFEQIVQSGTQDDKERVFETVYWMARGMSSMPATAVTAAPQPHPLAERTAAYVAPTSNGAAPQGEKRSRREQEADAFRAAFDRGLELMSE